MAALKAELAGMKTGALNKRAREVGVGVDAMDDAAAEDDPRAALIALIVAASPVPESAAEPAAHSFSGAAVSAPAVRKLTTTTALSFLTSRLIGRLPVVASLSRG